MSIFSSIGSFFTKLFASVMKIFRKILDALGPLLPLLIIALFVLAPWIGPFLTTTCGMPLLGGFFTTIGTTLAAYGAYASLAVGIGVAFVVAPEATTELIKKVGSGIGTIVSSVGGAVGSGVSSVLASLWPWVAAGLGVYYFVIKEDAPRSNRPGVYQYSERVTNEN